MRYLSLFSGIEAASVAWEPLGWTPVGFAEVEPFPSAVLAHHYPSVPNFGDVTKFKDWPDVAVDLICGGSPCQSFSVAGLRKGMDDPRGNLALVYLAIVNRYRPRWIVYENVPGILSSNDGRDFGSFLGALAELGYGWAYRVLDAQHCRVDGFPRAVPQRRRRVFVVGYLGDWRRAAAVLSEPESVLGDSPPRREAGEGSSEPIALSVAIRGRDGTPQAELGDDVANAILTPNGGRAGVGVGAILAFGGNNCSGPIDVAASLAAHGGPASRLDFASETFAIQERAIAENPESGPDGIGVRRDGVAYTLEARTVPQAVAFDWQQGGAESNSMRVWDEHTGTVAANRTQAVAFAHQAAGKQTTLGFEPELGTAPTLGVGQTPAMVHGWAVRRLMPVECERLQGFPDGYTDIPYRGKPAADGPRYKALGNSWAVNVARWVGRRIEMVEQIAAEEFAEAAE